MSSSSPSRRRTWRLRSSISSEVGRSIAFAIFSTLSAVKLDTFPGTLIAAITAFITRGSAISLATRGSAMSSSAFFITFFLRLSPSATDSPYHRFASAFVDHLRQRELHARAMLVEPCRALLERAAKAVVVRRWSQPVDRRYDSPNERRRAREDDERPRTRVQRLGRVGDLLSPVRVRHGI